MTQQASIAVDLTTRASDSSVERRAFKFWPLLLAVAIVAVVALIADSSLTPDQRMAAFLQSGMYP